VYHCFKKKSLWKTGYFYLFGAFKTKSSGCQPDCLGNGADLANFSNAKRRKVIEKR